MDKLTDLLSNLPNEKKPDYWEQSIKGVECLVGREIESVTVSKDHIKIRFINGGTVNIKGTILYPGFYKDR